MAKIRKRNDEGMWDERLKCHVQQVAYDTRTRTGRLDFPEACCCDMTGAIQLFSAIDPEVPVIETFAGGEADTVFRFNPTSREWTTFLRSA